MTFCPKKGNPTCFSMHGNTSLGLPKCFQYKYLTFTNFGKDSTSEGKKIHDF